MDSPQNCQCGKPSALLQTKKPGANCNRWFHVCRSRACNFFKWVGKRSVDSTSYVSRMQNKGLEQGIQGSGLIDAIRDRRTTVKFYIQSNTKIAITVGDNGYSLLSCIRRLPNAAFDGITLAWTIPATYKHYTHSYETLLRSPYYRSIQCTPLSDLVAHILKQDLKPCMEMIPCQSINDNDMITGFGEMTDAVDEKGESWLFDSSDQIVNLCAYVEETVNDRLKPYAIWNHLMDYQQQNVRECLIKGGRVLLADDMNQGKSIQALAVALAYSDEWPVLIICPTSLLMPWSDQIQKWLPMVSNKDIRVMLKGNDLFGFTPPRVTSIVEDLNINLSSVNSDIYSPSMHHVENDVDYGGHGKNRLFDSSSFYITSYEIAMKHCNDLARTKFKMIICDESHCLKNPKTKQTMFLTPLLQKAKHILLLTDTPMLARPIELFPQLHILRPDLFPDMNKYGLQYCNGRLMKYGWDFTGESNLQELNLILEKSVVIRGYGGIERPPQH